MSVIVSVAVQRSHFAVFVPSSVQVASLLDTYFVKLWPSLLPTSVIVSVTVQRSHFAVFVPSSIQVASLFDTYFVKL